MQMLLLAMHEALSANVSFKSRTIWQFVHTNMHVNTPGFRLSCWPSATCTITCQCGFFIANVMEMNVNVKAQTEIRAV